MTKEQLAALEQKLRTAIETRKAEGFILARGSYGNLEEKPKLGCLLIVLKTKGGEIVSSQWKEVAESLGIEQRQLTVLEYGFENWNKNELEDYCEDSDSLYELGEKMYRDYDSPEWNS